jgi:hypothetical protein
VAHVAESEQSERVRRHLSNCPACAHTARELDRVARGVGALLPLPPTVDAETVHRFGALGRALGRLLPFWNSGETAAAVKAGAAGAAAAGGGGAVGAGGSLAGLGAAKLGVAAPCAAGAAGGYVVCHQIGVFTGPLPRKRHQVATAASAERKHHEQRTPSATVARTPAPITHTIRRPPAATAGSPRAASSPSSSNSSAAQASSEFGFEGASGSPTSAQLSSSSHRSARAAGDAGPGTGTGSATTPTGSSTATGSRAASEFGFD